MPSWNYVETGPAQAGSPGALAPEGRGEQDYVEFLPDGGAAGSGPFRVDYQGNVTINGVTALKAGTDTSATATPSTPTFVSTTAQQLSTTQDTMLYITINTSAALAVAIGPANTTTTAIAASASYALGVITLRVPKGWWVKLTGTMANLTTTAVTC